MQPAGVFSTDYAPELSLVRTKTQWVWLLALLGFLVFALPSMSSAYWLTQFTGLCITAIMVLGLHILAGLCGLISIGQAAYMAIGAYIVAILTTRYDVNGWLCLPLCIIGAGIWGMIFGLPALKLKGFYLALATWASFEITMWLIRYDSFKTFFGGFTGLQMESLKIGSLDFGDDANMYRLAIVMVIIATLLTINVQRSNTGRILVAIRDNELAAEVSGIGIYRNKLIAFFIGCAFAGLAGWLYAYSQLRVNPSQYNLMDSIFYFGMIIIGGRGNLIGVFLGVFFLEFLGILNSDYLSPWLVDILPERWSAQIHVANRLVLGGLGMMFFFISVPGGLSGLWLKLKMAYRVHPYSYWGS